MLIQSKNKTHFNTPAETINFPHGFYIKKVLLPYDSSTYNLKYFVSHNSGEEYGSYDDKMHAMGVMLKVLKEFKKLNNLNEVTI